MISTKINWSLLQDAINCYKAYGYTHVDVPWIVPSKFKNITHNGQCYNPVEEDLHLVGSAEQAFLYVDFLGNLPPGKYVACTPCFRKYDNDITHSPYFMKVELYNNLPNVSVHEVKTMVKCAKNFFDSKMLNKSVSIVETAQGYDIELDKIELGSYGISEYNGKKWIYGTGIAEPRFSLASGIVTHNILSNRDQTLRI